LGEHLIEGVNPTGFFFDSGGVWFDRDFEDEGTVEAMNGFTDNDHIVVIVGFELQGEVVVGQSFFISVEAVFDFGGDNFFVFDGFTDVYPISIFENGEFFDALDAVKLAEKALGDNFLNVGSELLVGSGLCLADTEVDVLRIETLKT
jgi:hypothetical protein